MCEFASWVEMPSGRVKFLTKEQLETKRGKEMVKRIGTEDICGHGAIRDYWGLERDEGKDHECTDFSSPDNFPPEIVRAIKNGQFDGVGIGLGLLRGQAEAEYQKATGPALAEYQKATGQAWAEYEKVAGQALAEYEKVTGQAEAEYQKATGPALAEYQKVTGQAFWGIFRNPDNRIPAWR